MSCEDLGILQGSTYAQATRLVLKELQKREKNQSPKQKEREYNGIIGLDIWGHDKNKIKVKIRELGEVDNKPISIKVKIQESNNNWSNTLWKD